MAALAALMAASWMPLHAQQTSDGGDGVDEVLEQTRSGVRSTAVWLARGVDSWFGDRPFEEGGEVRNGELKIGLLRQPPDSAKLSVRFNARFRLPNLERRVYLFVGRDNPRDVIEDKPDAATDRYRLHDTNDADNRFFAGLGLSARDNLDLRLGFRRGVKPYAQARFRKTWQAGAVDLVEFRQTIFWSLDDHLGATTSLAVEHPLSNVLALRWLTSGTVTQASKRLAWTSNLGAFRSFGVDRQLSLEVIVAGAEHTGVGLTDYGVQTRWSQPVHKDWLIGEVIVGHFWPRENARVERNGAWALGATLRMKF